MTAQKGMGFTYTVQFSCSLIHPDKQKERTFRAVWHIPRQEYFVTVSVCVEIIRPNLDRTQTHRLEREREREEKQTDVRALEQRTYLENRYHTDVHTERGREREIGRER